MKKVLVAIPMIAAILLAVILIVLMCKKPGEAEAADKHGISSWFNKGEAEEEVEEDIDSEDYALAEYDESYEDSDWATMPEWHFYNTDLQYNESVADDFNFGPAVAAADANAADQELRSRMSIDPALSAAVMGYVDAKLGTRYLGTFCDGEDKDEWATIINNTKQYWLTDVADYDATLTCFFDLLNRASKRLETAEGTDKMYMNPATIDGTPDVIIRDTKNSGTYLIYTWQIKNAKFEVAYRLECGFQPTEITKTTKVVSQGSDPTPTPKPTKDNPSPSSDSTPNPGPKPTPTPNPTPNPDPDPTPPPKPDPDPSPKDPTKGTKVDPNDDDGPGKNTNNPDDPNHSTEDKDSNSSNLTPEDYDKTIDEMKDANVTPTPPAPPTNTKVDSNEDEANRATPVQDSSVADDKSAGSWDGPAD